MLAAFKDKDMNDTKLRAALKEALHEVSGMMVELAGAGSDEHILKEAREAGLAASMAIMDIALDLAAPVLPPAPSAPAREPLTDEQIEKLCAEIGFTNWPEWDGGTFQEMWMQLARAIEAAHGIK